ncbi:DUF4157 domain-containing protein, partial [Aquiflexum sp.]|uniref:eCIS core domain-containing protein n=1 Tax=Aquiflexum sp. TaxID=1872584 RepID=UPI0035936551
MKSSLLQSSKKSSGNKNSNSISSPAAQLQDNRKNTKDQQNIIKLANTGKTSVQLKEFAHLLNGNSTLQKMDFEEEEPLQGKLENIQRQGLEEEELMQGKFKTIQKMSLEEEEPLQWKIETIQRMGLEEEELLQGKFETIQKQENKTGLPENLKSGIENLSGYIMDDVKVHFNSPKPATLQAHAYAQGTEIHLAPGQEKHLPHEAWHVVQQKQGRVKPTLQMSQSSGDPAFAGKGGVNVNDDAGLEKEADVMGEKALNQLQYQRKKSKLNIYSAPIAQRNVNYSGYDGNRRVAVIKSVRNFESKEGISSEDALSDFQILEGMVKMNKRAEFFGEFDLNNYQHLGLLYHQIKRQGKGFENEKDEQELLKKDKPFKEKQEQEATTFGPAKREDLKIKGFFKLALLGMGSSIGYYITSLGKSYDHKHTIVIGKENPWESRRGIVPFVNHPMEMIEPWGKDAPESRFKTRQDEFSPNNPEDVFASRKKFAVKTKVAIMSPAATVKNE